MVADRRDEAMNAASGPTEVLITLVHGTWGRLKLPYSDPLWFEKGSDFTGNLQKQFDARGIKASIAPFIWSGANSVVDRNDASASLAKFLYRQKRERPGALQVLVAHSHGGTVCLMMLRRLSAEVDPVIITLATPFMEIINSEAMPSAERLKAAVAKRAMEPTVILVAFASSQAGLFGSVSSLGPSAYNMLYCVGMIAVGVVPYFLGVKEQTTEGPDDLGWLRTERLGPKQFEAITKGGATVESPRDVLVIRGVNDEAGFALTAGSIGTRLSSLGVDTSLRVLRGIGWLAGLCFLALVCLSYFEGIDAAGARVSAAITYPLVLYPALVAFGMFCLLPLVACLCKSVYGRELAIGGYFCEIKSGSSPDAVSEVEMITLPPTEGTGLRHGLYRHELAPRTIADFVAKLATKVRT
jgi:hypothetical protein